VSVDATVAELRAAYAEALPDEDARSLLAASVLATDDVLLHDSQVLPESRSLVVLPPISGG
jgi:molybdopterin converting factor small subunit